MAANSGQVEKGTRMSALWGTGGKRGDGSRSSVLWGKGGRTMLTLTIAAFAAMLGPWGAVGSPGTPPGPHTPPGLKGSGSTSVYITSTLLAQAQTSPHSTFNVIVQGD